MVADQGDGVAGSQDNQASIASECDSTVISSQPITIGSSFDEVG